MARLANTPREASVLELEQRKSFAVSVAFEEPNGAPIDLTNAVVVFTAALPAGTLERTATIAMPAAGVAVVALQAADLAVDPGTYPFAVTLRVSGYSLVVVKGELRVLANPETSSAGSAYAGSGAAAGLLAQLRGLQVIRVTTTAGVPGGTGAGLDATGVAAARVPTALGNGTWEWRVVPPPATYPAANLTGTLSPDRIANWSLRRSKLTIDTPDNLLPNGMFEQGGKLYPWTQDPRFVWQTEDRPAVGNAPPGAIVTQAGLGTNTLFDTEPYQAGFALEHGVAYEFEMWIKADKPNSRLYVEVRDENGAQAMNWTAVEGGAGASSYPVSNWVVPTEWTRVVSRGIPTPNPASKRSRARLGAWYLNHANGTERNASYTIGGIRIRRAQAANFNARLYGTTTADAAVVDDLQANLELRVGPADSRLSLAYGTVSATESGTPVPVYMPTGVEGLPTPTAGDQAATKAYTDAGDVKVTELGTPSPNLNDVTTTGRYWQSLNTSATVELNYPTTRAGLLEVFVNGSQSELIQRYTTFDINIGSPSGEFVRHRYNGVWGEWVLAVYDTGWKPVTITGSWTNEATDPVRLRRRGNTIAGRGRMTAQFNPNQTYTFATVGPEFCPPNGTNGFGVVVTTGAYVGWANINASGQFSIHFKSPWVVAAGTIDFSSFSFTV